MRKSKTTSIKKLLEYANRASLSTDVKLVVMVLNRCKYIDAGDIEKISKIVGLSVGACNNAVKVAKAAGCLFESNGKYACNVDPKEKPRQRLRNLSTDTRYDSIGLYQRLWEARYGGVCVVGNHDVFTIKKLFGRIGCRNYTISLKSYFGDNSEYIVNKKHPVRLFTNFINSYQDLKDGKNKTKNEFGYTKEELSKEIGKLEKGL